MKLIYELASHRRRYLAKRGKQTHSDRSGAVATQRENKWFNEAFMLSTREIRDKGWQAFDTGHADSIRRVRDQRLELAKDQPEVAGRVASNRRG